MINVLIPIVSKGEKFNKLLSQLNGNDEVMVYVGATKSQRGVIHIEESENITIFEYEDKSRREEILNSLSQNLKVGEIIVLRKPITIEEFEQFCICQEDIVLCKKNRSRTGEFFYQIWQKILKIILGVKLYEGDTSVVKFSENISAVLSQTHDFSYSTRVDRWKGLKSSTIETKEEAVKPEVDSKFIAICSCIAFLALIIGLTTSLLVCLLTKVSIMAGLLIFCLDAICMAVILVMFVMIGFNCQTGKKYNNKAK